MFPILWWKPLIWAVRWYTTNRRSRSRHCLKILRSSSVRRNIKRPNLKTRPRHGIGSTSVIRAERNNKKDPHKHGGLFYYLNRSFNVAKGESDSSGRWPQSLSFKFWPHSGHNPLQSGLQI